MAKREKTATETTVEAGATTAPSAETVKLRLCRDAKGAFVAPLARIGKTELPQPNAETGEIELSIDVATRLVRYYPDRYERVRA